MAETRFSQDEFICKVCLDLLKDPVNLICGHSYCKRCITGCLDQEDENRVYSCPQCRETSSSNPILAKMVEKLNKSKRPAGYAGAGNVQCDVCTERKYKAIKSCLECQKSYCETHFGHHEELHSRKPHKVIDATGRLQDTICRKHEKELEMYCITDQQDIGGICKEYEHKNHQTALTATQRTEKRKEVKETQLKLQQRQKDLQQPRKVVESQKTAVEDTERIFTELTQTIRGQEKTAGLREGVKQEIDDLRMSNTELEQLPHTQDNIHFLQVTEIQKNSIIMDLSKIPQWEETLRSFQSLSAPPEFADVSFSSLSFDGQRESVHLLKVEMEDFCKEEIKISDREKQNKPLLKDPLKDTIMDAVPKTRRDFQKYSHQFTVDLNTVNKYLHLSESNRVITNIGFFKSQSYPDHPDRFDRWYQVLCRESVCGRCYWEIEWCRHVFISVSYKSISRKGRDYNSVFGHNDQSWSLICSPSSYSFIHNDIKTNLSLNPISSRIGVYVDHSAGTLSFYSISDTDTMSLIHTIYTKFTQPLYAGFGFYAQSSVKM